MEYTLEEAIYGQDWYEYDHRYRFPSNDLEACIEYAKRIETHDKYHFRLVDDEDNIVWTKTLPYEGIAINLADSPVNWLQAIRNDYGIDDDDFAAACRAWLEQYGGKE